MNVHLRSSLYLKIILWMLLNLALIGGLLIGITGLRYQFDPDRFLVFTQNSQFEVISRVIADELRELTADEQNEILDRYGKTWQVDLVLFAPHGRQLAGRPMTLPEQVNQQLQLPLFPPGRPQSGERPPPPGPEGPPGPPPPSSQMGPPDAPAQRGPGQSPRPRGFLIRTTGPTLYWAGARIPYSNSSNGQPGRGAVLIAVSDSMTGHGLFFDPLPLVVLATSILLISILLWLPFVRRLTRTIRQLTDATEQIAEERFDIRVATSRADELGRLGRAVNHLAGRLDGFVKGQKRFLGDISHELNSPLARMGIALEILEERADPTLHNYIRDVREEVTLMSELVSELLVYARSGLKGVRINLAVVPLRPLVEKVVAREAGGFEVRIKVGDDLQVLAQPELLSRALANVVRNALRYAGEAGSIEVRAEVRAGVRAEGRDDLVVISVIDQGPGIPDNQLDRIFDPFYRLEDDRARATGGTGLGLAIVRTCVEAGGGRVSAHNHHPGFEIRIELPRQ